MIFPACTHIAFALHHSPLLPPLSTLHLHWLFVCLFLSCTHPFCTFTRFLPLASSISALALCLLWSRFLLSLCCPILALYIICLLRLILEQQQRAAFSPLVSGRAPPRGSHISAAVGCCFRCACLAALSRAACVNAIPPRHKTVPRAAGHLYLHRLRRGGRQHATYPASFPSLLHAAAACARLHLPYTLPGPACHTPPTFLPGHHPYALRASCPDVGSCPGGMA